MVKCSTNKINYTASLLKIYIKINKTLGSFLC